MKEVSEGDTSFTSNQTISNALFGLNVAHRALFNENGATAAAALVATALVSVAYMGIIFPNKLTFVDHECRHTPYSNVRCS